MGVIGRVLKHEIDKFVNLVAEIWQGFNVSAAVYNASGEDSVPCKDDRVILIKTEGTGRYIAIGILNRSQKAKPGEKILFGRDVNGKVVCTISMLNDGSVSIEADGDINNKSKKNITAEAAEKNTVKGKEVEITGNTKLTGGSVECNGTASPTGTGCWCAKPFCTWDGSPHTGNKADRA